MLPVAGKPHCHALVAELTEFELLEVLLDAEVAVQAGVCERLSCSPAARVQKHLCCIFFTLKRPVPSPVWGGTLIVAPVGSTEGQQRSVQFPSAGSRCRLTCESCNEITRLTSVCGPEDVRGPAGAEFQIRRPGRGPGSRKLSFWEAAFTFRTAAGWQVQTSESRHPGRASPSPFAPPTRCSRNTWGFGWRPGFLAWGLAPWEGTQPSDGAHAAPLLDVEPSLQAAVSRTGQRGNSLSVEEAKLPGLCPEKVVA